MTVYVNDKPISIFFWTEVQDCVNAYDNDHYLAAGSCNFNNSGTSLWPLNQITNDTQYYVRDAVIDYVTYEGTIAPAIEGRLSFITDTVEPETNITAQPANPASNTDASFSFTGSDADSGLAGFECKLDGSAFAACTSPKNYTGLTPGLHTFSVRAIDNGGNVDSTPASYTWLARTERLKNRGFNIYPSMSKIPKGWVAKNFSLTDGKNTRFKKEGLASVRIVGAPKTVKTLSRTIKMSGNATDVMTFSFWARGSSIPAAGMCKAQVLLYKGTVLKSKKTIPCDKGTYLTFQQKSITFTAGVPYTKVVVKFTYSKAKGSIWFDLVSLIK